MVNQFCRMKMKYDLIAALIVVATALDIATYFRLPLMGAEEVNTMVLTLGANAVILKILVGGAITVAVIKHYKYFIPVGILCASWWGFGAWVNSL